MGRKKKIIIEEPPAYKNPVDRLPGDPVIPLAELMDSPESSGFKPVPFQESKEPEVKDEFDIRASALELEIEKKYTAAMVQTFKELAYEITVIGLQLQEACIITGVEYEKLVVLMRDDPLIERLIKTKDLEYKRKLLKTVSIKAGSDDKRAMELLQARYPDEFNPRKGSAGGGDGSQNDDLLGIAIEFIQRSGDSTPIVSERSAKITAVKRTVSENQDMVRKIGEILK